MRIAEELLIDSSEVVARKLTLGSNERIDFANRSRLRSNEFNPARRNSLSYVGGRESCVSWANPNVGMRLTFQLSLRQGIAGARQSWLRLSGQRPGEFKWVSTG